MKRVYFGTDGIRGPFGGLVINEEFAERLGFAVAAWLPFKGRVLIGRDTRRSGSALEAAMARGLRAGGAKPLSLGVVPTPAVARAVVAEDAVLGVVITASHNPAGDNGIKFFDSKGLKLTDESEMQIEANLAKADSAIRARSSDGMFESAPGAAANYIKVTQALLPAGALTGWRIVLDTANGATCGTSPVVFRALGAEVFGVGDQPDGDNINAGVGSEYPQGLADRVLKTGSRLGVAHDGDGDRCVLCDEHGKILDGDEILTILAIHALRCGTLPNRALVVTVQSNLGVDAAVVAAGGNVARTSVGDRYVIERMLADGTALGGESSGHIICAEISRTGDGLVAALKIIEVMLATGQPLSELRRALKKFPQATAALRVRAKRPLESLPTLTSEIRALEKEMGAQGRVLVRFSGTEDKLRLLVEGPTETAVHQGITRLEAAVRIDLEVC
jgi:phosphoglucosamine mutase